MDNVNTKIGQSLARESASVLTDKTFSANNMVASPSGVSVHTKSENAAVIQQVKNADKTSTAVSEKSNAELDKKLKANKGSADTLSREENVRFSESISNINNVLQTNGTEISFKLDNSAERPVVIVTDKESGNVIRQIPSEEVLKFAERLKEIESESSAKTGIVVDRQA